MKEKTAEKNPKKKVRRTITMSHLVSHHVRSMAAFFTIAALLVGIGLFVYTMVLEANQTIHSVTGILSEIIEEEDLQSLSDDVRKMSEAIPSFEMETHFDKTSKVVLFSSLERTPPYERIQQALVTLREKLERVDAVYLFIYDEGHRRMVYIAKSFTSMDDRIYPIGTMDNMSIFDDYDSADGKTTLDATIFIDKVNGLFLTGGDTYFNSAGEPVAMMGVDINLRYLLRRVGIYASQMIVILLLVTIVIHLVFLHRMNKAIEPVKAITQVAEEFTAQYQNNEISGQSEGIFQNIDGGFIVEFNKLVLALKTLETGLQDYMGKFTTVTRDRERIATELNLATAIQTSTLPNIFPPFPNRKEFDLYATMNPAKEVGGDFYDFFLVDDDHLALVIADVSGKGVPAALFMMASKIMLNDRTMLGASPAQILQAVNHQLCQNNTAEMFVTVWLGILEISTGRLTAANAGHEIPVIRRSGGAFELYKDRHGFIVGGMDGVQYTNYEMTLAPGDRLFVYTDGLPEANNAENAQFGTERMLAALNASPDDSPRTLLDTVNQHVDAFVAGADQFDDLTMLTLNYYGGACENTITLDAKTENWDDVLAFIEGCLEKMDCPMKVMTQIAIAAEEIYVNVASYAYGEETGKVTVTVDPAPDRNGAVLIFTDSGVEYDPLAKEDPDISLTAEDRPIGGLGIFMVKKTMDDMRYERKDGKNVLTIKKYWA